MLLVGFAITAFLTRAAFESNNRSSTRLLRLQTRQAASALSAALPGIQRELSDALRVATATGSPSNFTRFVRTNLTKPDLASESLWKQTNSGTVLVASTGMRPQLVRDGQASAFFSTVHPNAELQVTKLLPGSPPRLGYAEFPPGSHGFLVYAESALPADRHLTIPKSSPYYQLNVALYLGKRVKGSQLIASSAPIPERGRHAVVSVPFGDSALTFVSTPRTSLTPGASQALPWVALAGGTLLSLASAGIIDYLSRRRRLADDLNAKLGQLYAEQRSIAETLQRALLPERLPQVAGIEIAARYWPGASDVDIGGDWYDVVVLDGEHFVFIVGDVSGRGVRAAAVMASLRFASRTLAQEGHSPVAILQQLNKSLDLNVDGHFATVLCGMVDVVHHEVTLANAGHPPAIVRSIDRITALEVPPMPPIGVAADARPDVAAIHLPDEALLLAYTDGLIERRGEGLDQGIERLEKSASQEALTVDELLGNIISDLTMDAPDDDVALLGLRWLT